MIEIYLKTNTNYKSNGDITLDPTLCTYKDSEKLLTLEHFQDEEGRWKYIDFENVIAVEENEKKILYRIFNVVRSLYSVKAYARPIFYDLIDKVLLDVRPTQKLGEEALNIILANTGFIGHSNLTTLSTAYYVRKNIVEALIGDISNSFINRWGGEFYCENFDVYINDRIGSDNGVRVEFGYNLNELEEDINIEEVVTRIVPVGFDGIVLEGNSPWVDSPLINKYTQPKMRVIEFLDIKVKENTEDEEGFNTIEEARAELIRQCKLLYEGGIDKPIVNYKIDMINLANTTEYEDFKMLTTVNKGDTVTCYIPHLDIDVKARVIDFERDLITGEYISIELGNEVNDFFKNQSDIKDKIDNILNSNGNVKAETLEGAINALQTKFKALRDIAQPQTVRAILFEDRIVDSPTFGCMCLGTSGFEIASTFKPGTEDWDFRTFGTGQGFVADHIITGILNATLIKAGILKSVNGTTWIDMENGTFNFADKIKFDGNNFEIDLSNKNLVTDNEIISSINKTIETVKIKADKIQLEGTTTIAGASGDKVRINNANYEILNGDISKAFFGLKEIDDNRLVPRLALSHSGLNQLLNNYFVMTAHDRNNNPLGTSSSYVDFAYRCQEFKLPDGTGDVSNIRMISNGDIHIAAIRETIVRSNMKNGIVSTDGTEYEVGKFSSSGSAYFDGNLQIDCVRNIEDRENGLVLADYGKGADKATVIRIATDNTGTKFVRPVDDKKDIRLGSPTNAWYNIYTSLGTYSSEGVVSEDITTYEIEDIPKSSDEILDGINFFETRTFSEDIEENNNSLKMDVTGIVNTCYVEKDKDSEETYINIHEMVKLLIYEVKKLKDENNELKEMMKQISEV